MILISYCVILLPSYKLAPAGRVYVILSFFLILPNRTANCYTYGLLLNASVVIMVALLLYLVLLSVVAIIDYSRGRFKYYVKSSHLRINHIIYLFIVSRFVVNLV